MTDLTLPGSIPGLLRRGSPVVKWWSIVGDDGLADEEFLASGAVLKRLDDDIAGQRWLCWFDDPRIGKDVGAPPALDLRSATGRAHATWWAMANMDEDIHLTQDARRALALALRGFEMSDDDVRALRLVCLHVAGMGVES